MEDDLARVRDLYGQWARERPGYGPEVTNYQHPASQKARMDAAVRLIGRVSWDLQGSIRVLDVGCGTGDLFEKVLYLNGVSGYTGVDICPELIMRCQDRFPAFKDRFLCADIRQSLSRLRLDGNSSDGPIPECDLAVAVCAFNEHYGDARPDKAFPNSHRVLRETVEAMFDRATLGVFVTLLAPHKLWVNETDFVVDPAYALHLGRTLTERVSIDWTYAPHDYALILLKPDSEWRTTWDEAGGWES